MTPLGAAFNSRPSSKLNLMGGEKNCVSNESTGLFGFPELTRPEGFEILQRRCIQNSESLIEEACQDPSKRTRIVARIFDDLSDELCRVADMAEFVRLAHPDQKMAKAAENVCIAISGLVERLNTHSELFEVLRKVVVDGDRYPEEDVDKHVAKLFLQDFLQCGIHLEERSRHRVVELNDRILQLGQQFAAGTHKSKSVKKSVLPPQIRHQFNIDGDNIILSGLQVDSPQDLAREAAFKIYYWHDQFQEDLLQDILTSRNELAQLCGYPTFAHRAMVESLAEKPEKVEIFLRKLSQELRPRVSRDYATMLALKKKSQQSRSTLEMWDVPYFTIQAKNNFFNLDSAQISEYFSLGVCMEGLNTLYQNIFNVYLEVETPATGEVWHNDIFKLSVRDCDTQEVLGHIYCDFFIRSGKPFQDCHFTIQGGRLKEDNSYQNPVVVLMLNLPAPGWSRPTLLTSGMMENLFHEMGHAMHSMLARTKYQHVTGTRCSTDFAEVPSTLMEYFAADPRVLTSVARHYKTGSPMPQGEIDKFCAAKRIFSGVDVQSQLFYSILDQEYHGKHPLDGTTTQILEKVQGTHHSLRYQQGTAWQLRFSHLVGYGARYYSYLMARSVASTIWQKYFSADPFDRDCGAKYRQECLSHGGGKPSHRLISDYLGFEVRPEDLSDALIAEIDAKNDEVKFVTKKNT